MNYTLIIPFYNEDQNVHTLNDQIINNIKIVNGNFISIWHNESLNDNGKWVNWKSVYEDMIKFINNIKKYYG